MVFERAWRKKKGVGKLKKKEKKKDPKLVAPGVEPGTFSVRFLKRM